MILCHAIAMKYHKNIERKDGRTTLLFYYNCNTALQKIVDVCKKYRVNNNFFPNQNLCPTS